MKISKCLITLIVVMFLTSSVNAGNNKPQGSNGGPQSSPSGLSPAPQTGTKSTPSPITQTPGIKPSSSNASPPSSSPSASNSTAKPTTPSTPKLYSPNPSQSGKVPSPTPSTPRKVDSASLSEYNSSKQRINSYYDKQASDLRNNKSSLSSAQYNSKIKSIENGRQKALDHNQATFDARSGGPTKSNSTQSPTTTPQPPTSGKTTASGLPPNPADKWSNNTNTPLPPNPADKWSNNSKTALPINPANPQSSTKNGVSGSSGLGDKKSSPNQETAQGPYWQWRDNQIKAWNNELGKLDKKQDALGKKAGQKYWSPAARSEYQAAVAALDKDRAAINQKYNLNNEQYIKTNYPEYYARNYAGKGSSQSLTGIPSQPNVSSPLTTTSQATTTTSTKKPPFDSSIWSIEKSLQEGRSYNEAPWHNKLVRQWELDQNHPWNPITSQKDPAREAAEKAINDQYKRELEMSKLLRRSSSLPTDKIGDAKDPIGKASVAIAAGIVEAEQAIDTALNWFLPKDKEVLVWDDYKDKDGDFKDWPH